MKLPPLVLHLTYVLDHGGLETLIVDTINRMPVERYRHSIVCLTKVTDFAERITRPGVEVISLDKQPGPDLMTHVRLWRLLKRMKPTILHTYNLTTAEYTLTAAVAGVPVRIHAEHGRDASDPEGRNPKHRLLRRLMTPFIDRFIAVSNDLREWLAVDIGIAERKLLVIDNGVDTARFHPPSPEQPSAASTLWGFDPACFVIGTVGRLQEVKDHATLIDAFIALRASVPDIAARLRLVIVGGGPLLPALSKKVQDAGIADLVLLPGGRDDIALIMRSFSVFAMSSIAEGTPVTMLEAMASGLPVVSTRVGGIAQLVIENSTGLLAPARDASALASALAQYARDPELARAHGAAGRDRIKQKYSIDTMVASYATLYDGLCKRKTKL